MKIYFEVSTGCLHFEIYQEDTRRVSVVWEKKKKKIVSCVTLVIALLAFVELFCLI